MSDVTIFLSTRNRTHLLKRTLDNMKSICPQHHAIIGNASSKKHMEEVSSIINNYDNIEEVKFVIDLGMADVYNKIFKMIKTKYALIWADDIVFLKKFDHLLEHFNDPNVKLIGIPMIDDRSNAPNIGPPWKTDEFGCVLWETPTGRCANHSIVRMEHFEKYPEVFLKNEYIDQFFHNHTTQEQRIWASGGAYSYHTRYEDETRINTVIADEFFRCPKVLREKHGFFSKTRADRDKETK